MTYPHNTRADRLPASSLSFPHFVLLLLALFFWATANSLPNKLATHVDNICHLGDNQPPTGPLQKFAKVAASQSWVVVL